MLIEIDYTWFFGIRCVLRGQLGVAGSSKEYGMWKVTCTESSDETRNRATGMVWEELLVTMHGVAEI